ncbi:hypothetical protein P168DRAFT_260046 [Aspergillus campestris IBT 28561]|uniref:Hybrid NRPS/PKS enzyme n=1 Tax=Aspergillus campestris (strain IBT 28561) TaxID=1392248 RepID=A0A2I1CSG6_ASPC2|nr:uncharacterized protein P168DRAFT_260046 [Aspergillus campestris IBT 28561]PKY00558.1 hypothetical protein P168DRAFT_260046 [Aspergillus campestris IBT 28561]
MSPNEPIAIIGFSCRFAGGASSPSKLWDLLRDPKDLSKPPPETRFNLEGFYHPYAEQHGNTNVHGAYFLDEDPRCFDTVFFNISPKEAEAIDPQQRILLEMVYEAMEAAGLTLQGLQGSDTSVYAGLMIRDYMDVQARDPDYFSQYMVTGTSSALNANRISYFFDWHGPSLTVDTACSSSLVAVHQAVQGLRAGESRIACVTGSNLLLGPELFISASNMHMMSSRSKMWDTSADGYARGDGFATFMLKTLSNAIADGDHIEAIIRETGVNSDGRTKGITLPSPQAQAELIRDTYRRAGLDPSNPSDRCQYFEAHGTGTQAGDPREASAIYDAFFGTEGADNKVDPKLVVGSIKTVVGHTEGTAGMAGILKALLAIRHRVIPPNLHFNNLNPSVVPFYDRVIVPTEPMPWPAVTPGKPVRASVNSFGFGGTNAHAILESYEPGNRTVATDQGQGLALPLKFSAYNEKALLSVVENYAAFLRQNQQTVNLRDLVWTLHTRRSHLPVKVAFCGLSASDIADQMENKLESVKKTPGTELGTCSPAFAGEKPSLLGVFTGQGAQWPTMGKHLIESSRIFRDTIERLEKCLSELDDGPDWSLKSEILAPKATSRVAEAALSQPLCTAIAIALVDLLHASGVNFTAVVGHSSGEIGAAYAAGVITAEEGMKIAYYRGKYAKLAEGKNGAKGGMLAVGMGFDEARDFCDQVQFKSRLGVAASNSPTGVTLSGDLDAVHEAKELFDTRKSFARMLQVDTAYHSHHMLPCADPYVASLNASRIEPKDPAQSSCTWISSVYGSDGDPTVGELSAVYWRDNMAQAVLFSQALERAMIECGPFDAVLEVGPHPALKGPASQTLRELSDNPLPYFGVLDRKRNDTVAFGDALASLWIHFGPSAVDLEGYAAGSGPKDLPQPKVVKDLPAYPWDHSQVYWRESRLSKEFRTRASPPHELLGHLLPGGLYEGGLRWRNILRLEEVPWIGDHRFQGQALLPTSAFCSMAVDAALKLSAGSVDPVTDCIELHDLVIHNAVSIPDGSHGVEIITSIHRLETANHPLNAEFTVLFGPPDGSQGLKKAASAHVKLLRSGPAEDPAPIRTREKWLDSLDIPLATIKHLTLDPSLVEGCIQAAYAAFSAPDDAALRRVFLPQKVERMSLRLSAVLGSDSLLVIDSYVTSVEKATANRRPAFHTDIEVSDSVSGKLLVELEGVTISSFSPTSAADDRELFLQTVWKPAMSEGISVGNEQQRKIANQAALDMEHQSILYLETLFANNLYLSGDMSREFAWLAQLSQAGPSRGSQNGGNAAIASHLDDFEALRAVAKKLPDVIRGRVPGADLEQQLLSFVETNSVFKQINDGLYNLIDHITHRFAHLNVLEIAPAHLRPSFNAFGDLADLISSYTLVTNSPSKDVANYGRDFTHIPVQTLHTDPSAITSALNGQRFDIVIASYLLNGQAASFSEEALREFRKVLTAGGYLILVEPTQEYVWSRIFLGVLLGSEANTGTGRDIGCPLSSVSLDGMLRNVGFSGVDSLLPRDANGPGDAISLFVTQALDETIDLLRHPLQPSALGTLEGSRVLVIGGKTLRTSRLWHNIASALRPWAKEVFCIESFEDLRTEDTTDVAGAIVLTDLDEPASRLLTPNSYNAISGLFAQAPHVLWVTHNALQANPEQAASIGIGHCLAQEHPSAHFQFLDLDTLEESEYKILGSFMRLLIPGVHDSQASRLWTTEMEISVKDGQVLIPRVFPTRSMNDRLNSHWRPIVQTAHLPKDTISLSSSGSLHAPTYAAQHINSPSITGKRPVLHTTYSVPIAINISNGVYLYVSAGQVDNVGNVLAFTDTISSRAPALATWKIPAVPESGSFELNNLLELTANVLAAHHIIDSLPTGNSVLLEPSPTLANVIIDLTKGSEKKVYFLTTAAREERGSVTWTTVPPLASKRHILSVLPHCPKLFFDLSPDPTRLASRIVQLLPLDCAIYGQGELFQLGSEGADDVSTPWLQHVLLTVASSALKLSRKATYLSSSPLTLNDLLEHGIHNGNAMSVVDWTHQKSIPLTVEPFEPSHLLSSTGTYVLVDTKSSLTHSITNWLIANGVRDIGEHKTLELLDELMVQNLKADLTNLKDARAVFERLPKVTGVIYGGASPAICSFGGSEAPLESLLKSQQRAHNLTTVLGDRGVDFFIILSSLQKDRAPANAYFTSLASHCKQRGPPTIVVSLESQLDSDQECPFIRLSESDVHYALTEAISSALSRDGVSAIWTGVKRLPREVPASSTQNWLFRPLFSHHTLRGHEADPRSSQGEVQSMMERIAVSKDHQEASLVVQEFFMTQLAAMLTLSPESLSSRNDLTSLGVDSLSASDIRAWFLKELDADVSILKVLGGYTIADLCDEVAADLPVHIGLQEEAVSPPAVNSPEHVTAAPVAKQPNIERPVESLVPVLEISVEASSSNSSSEGIMTPQTSRGFYTPRTEITSLQLESVQSKVCTPVQRQEKMSFSQNRLWFPTAYLQQDTPFNCTTSYTLTGPLDVARLEHAFQRMIERHESFCTAFYTDADSGQAMQRVLASSPFQMRTILGNKDDVQRVFREVANYRFDLSVADTLVASLISHGPKDHTIVFGYHHIIMDGVSWQITLNDLASFYESENPELPTLSQYIDFSVKQRQLVSSGAHNAKLSYWRKEFPSAPPLLPLFPFAKVGTRKALTRYDTLDYVYDVDTSLVSKIKKASLAAKTTTFHFYLAAFMVLLNRFLETDDVCLGIIDANRSDKAFLNTVGFLLDMLPLRLKVNKKERFVHTLRNTKSKAYGALENSGVPLETILKELQIPTSSTSTPLFQVLMNYRMGALRAPQMGDAKMNFLDYEDAKAPFDLAISIDEKDDGTGMLTFSMQDYMYDREGAELLVKTYVHLLDTLATDSSQRLNEVPLFDETLVNQSMVAGTGPVTGFDWAQTETISQRVDAMTAEKPDGVAVKDLNGKARTYAETQARVHALSHSLQQAGVTPGSQVAVYCEPTVDTVASILAIHRVGAAYVPLDVRNSFERLQDVVRQCKPALILYHGATKLNLADVACDGHDVLDIDTVPQSASVHVPDASKLSDPAVILYTSGSTGKPKGIMLTHANLSIHFASISDALSLTDRDVVLQQSALGFDASLAQMFMALTNGGTLIHGSNRGDPIELAALIEREEVTLTLIMVSEMSALLQYGRDILSRCQSWRIALCGGEAFTINLLRKFRDLDLPNLDLYNAYGPTETTIMSSLGKVSYRRTDWEEGSVVPVGPPLPNYGVYVLDEYLQPCPLGWPGELCICGPGVAPGYVGLPELTASKFQRDQLRKPQGSSYEGWGDVYRTGDKARLLKDGSFVFLGRMDGDSQVKLRGIRIELNDISSSIIQTSNEAIVDATTIVKGTTSQLLVSFVVLSPAKITDLERSQSSASAYLRQLIRTLPLPVYMRPAIAVPLQRLPFTERGKLDVKALAAIPIEEDEETDNEELSDTEKALKQVWQDILSEQGLPLEIRRDSDFFSVGGNSLMLMRVRAKMLEVFGVSVPLAQLFQASTLESLASRIDGDTTAQTDTIVWGEETTLDPSLPPAIPRGQDHPEKHLSVVLTGSTGFLGREIVRQLVAEPRISKIHCLAVRPGRTLPKELVASSKVIVHTGDLAAERLGLSASQAEEIFSSAAAIFHNGAEVSHMKSYHSLRKTNVGSTRQLVELALRSSIAAGVPTPAFHYVSTAGVGHLLGKPSFPEQSVSPFPPPVDGSDGYVAAKWASERILEQASGQLGLPVFIHRPSNITGPDVGDRDIIHNVWKWSESLRTVPDILAGGATGAFDFVGVETCAKGITDTLFVSPSAGSLAYFHQSGENVIPVQDFRIYLQRKSGEEVGLLPFDEWVDKAVQAGLDDLVASFLRGTKGAFQMPLLPKAFRG